MRFDTNNVGAQLVRELLIAGAVRRILHDGRDIIHVELITGQSLMIYLIERRLPLTDIQHIVAENDAQGIHTLFILWADMLLPAHESRCQPEDWQLALLSLYGDRIYAYEVYHRRVYIFPVHFERQAHTTERVVWHGSPIDVGAIHCRTVESESAYLRGVWRVAAFDGDPDAYHRQRAEDIGQPLPDALRDYYALLQVEPGAGRDEIKQAYRRLARQVHPDLSADEDATERMQALNRAYAVLLRALEED